MSELIASAKLFATAAHEAVGQKRKYTGEPYINHPTAVAQIVAEHGGTDEMIAAAWLHDVVEDTEVTLDTIRELFGEKVANLVYWLTDISKPEDGNRAKRKALDREHIAKAPYDAQVVKVADIIDNTSTITKYDPDYAKVYLKEKELLLQVLNLVDSDLLAKAMVHMGAAA